MPSIDGRRATGPSLQPTALVATVGCFGSGSRFGYPFPIFPIPDSRFPIPDSRFPIPDSQRSVLRQRPSSPRIVECPPQRERADSYAGRGKPDQTQQVARHRA